MSNLDRWLSDMRLVNQAKENGPHAQAVMVLANIARSLAVIADSLEER